MLNAIVEGMRKARMRRCKFSVALCAEKWMHFLWMRRRELDDIYNIISRARARAFISELHTTRQPEVSVSLKSCSPYILFDDLQKVDHEDLSSPRASDISLQRRADIIRGFSRGLLLFRACTAFEDVSPKETRPVEPLLQIVICVHQGERTRTKIASVIKVSIKR